MYRLQLDEADYPLQPLPDRCEPVPGERLTFRVASRSRPKPWRVDLEAWGFNGECECEAFNFHHLPKLKADFLEGRPARRRRCWHIQRAFEYHAEVQNRIEAHHAYLNR